MHLIDTATFQLHTVVSEEDEDYAILSHRWREGEVLYEDIEGFQSSRKEGVAKLQAFCAEARQYADSRSSRNRGFRYVWADTCCIDKKSSAELSEAINSMYKYYSTATVCMAYLDDVHVAFSDPDFESQFRRSEWFTRCWTLQELIAPSEVVFYNARWERLSTKAHLRLLLSDITGVDAEALCGLPLNQYSVAERMAWAANRKATRREDVAYSLIGLFNVNMPMLYGEGTKAYERLQEEILRETDDETIFAWSSTTISPTDTLSGGLFAPSPVYFQGCQNLKCCSVHKKPQSFTMTNQGIAGSFMMQKSFTRFGKEKACLALLNVSFRQPTKAERFVGIFLMPVGKNEHDIDEYTRVSKAIWQGSDRWEGSTLSMTGLKVELSVANIRHKGSRIIYQPNLLHGFDFSHLVNPGLLFSLIFDLHGPEPSYEIELRPRIDVAPVKGSLDTITDLPKTIMGETPDVDGTFCRVNFADGSGRYYHISFGLTDAKCPVCIFANEPYLNSFNIALLPEFTRPLDVSDFSDYLHIPWTIFEEDSKNVTPGKRHYKHIVPNPDMHEGFLAIHGNPDLHKTQVWECRADSLAARHKQDIWQNIKNTVGSSHTIYVEMIPNVRLNSVLWTLRIYNTEQ